MRRAIPVLVAVTVAATLAACSSDNDSTENSATDPTAPASSASTATVSAPASTASTPDEAGNLEAAVRAYSSAFLTGKADNAYTLLSERCRDRTAKSEFAVVVQTAGKRYGEKPIQTLSPQISGDMARVTYTYGPAAAELNQDREPWVREGGKWHNDDC